MTEEQHKRQVMSLENRRTLRLNTVKNVESFDEEELVLETEGGEVHIEGEGLRIESLSKETTEILILGRIDGIYFSTEKPHGEKRLFGRWFK